MGSEMCIRDRVTIEVFLLTASKTSSAIHSASTATTPTSSIRFKVSKIFMASSAFGFEIVEKDRDFGYQGKAIICGVETKPLGGHRLKSRFRKDDDGKPRTMAYVADLGNGVLVPVRFETNLFFGRLVTRLNMRQSSFEK